MPSVNRTDDFRHLVSETAKGVIQLQRRRTARNAQSEEELKRQSLLNKEYTTQGYNILNHLHTLTRMLNSIRRPYLNVDNRDGAFSRAGSNRTIDLSGGDQACANVRYLTNEERDQIDLQAKDILSRCAKRVREMEELEKKRQHATASKGSSLLRLLPARLKGETEVGSSDFRAVHNTGITWYLNRRLAETSQSQKEMQEERIKRQLERTRTLGSGATREAAELGMGFSDGLASSPTPSKTSGPGSWLEGASSTLASALGSPYYSESFATASTAYANISDDDDEEEEDLELSQSQILQFEEENAQILKSVQDTLLAVQQAESRLLDISALQMELVTHLTHQSELSDQLYEDAVAATSMVEKGNVQLREAKRRARDSRMWILLFLLGASFSLLFLHYY